MVQKWLNNFSFFIFLILLIFLLLTIFEYISKKIVNTQIEIYKNSTSQAQIDLIEKYSQRLHHIREPNLDGRWYKNKNATNKNVENNILPSTDIMFSEYNLGNNINSNQLILFQGDSVMEQMYFPYSRKVVEKYLIKNNKRGINAGTSSYSISPMTIQLKILREDFGIQPTQIVAHFNFTDIGDELCRYKDKLKINSNNELISIMPEPFNSGEIYSLQFYLLKYKYINDNKKFALQKLFLYSFLKIKYFFLNQKRKCTINEILHPISEKINNNEEEYIINAVQRYVKEVFSDINVKNLIIFFYPSKTYLENENKYTFKWSDILNKIQFEKNIKDKIIIVDFYKIFPDLFYSKGLNYNNIFRKDDLFHLSDTPLKENDFNANKLAHPILTAELLKYL